MESQHYQNDMDPELAHVQRRRVKTHRSTNHFEAGFDPVWWVLCAIIGGVGVPVLGWFFRHIDLSGFVIISAGIVIALGVFFLGWAVYTAIFLEGMMFRARWGKR